MMQRVLLAYRLLLTCLGYCVAACFAAFTMRSVTSTGCESIATWLEGTAIEVALILRANVSSSSGEMVRSFVAMTNQDGLFFHAGAITGAPNATPAVGPSVTSTCCLSRSVTS